MSRAELAEAVNDHLWRATGKRYALDAHTVARYERGKVRWPSAAYRSALKAVLGVDSDSDLGFHPTRRGIPGSTTRRECPRELSSHDREHSPRRTESDTEPEVELGVNEIRKIVAGFDTPDDGPTRDIEILQQEVAEIVQLRVQSRYSLIFDRLPILIPELTRSLISGSEDRCIAAGLLVQAYRAADAAVNKLGLYDLSSRIIQVMIWAAQQADDIAVRAAVSYVRAEDFFSTRDYKTGARILEKASDSIPLNSAKEMAAYGSLHMRTAVLHGRGGSSQRAQDHLDEASEIAARICDGIYTGTAFGPGSVRIHDVTLALEIGDPVRALAAAAGWAPPSEIPAERTSHFHIDLARAQFAVHKPDGVIGSLNAAYKIAPEHTRSHPHVKGLINQMVSLGGAHEREAYTFFNQTRENTGLIQSRLVGSLIQVTTL